MITKQVSHFGVVNGPDGRIMSIPRMIFVPLLINVCIGVFGFLLGWITEPRGIVVPSLLLAVLVAIYWVFKLTGGHISLGQILCVLVSIGAFTAVAARESFIKTIFGHPQEEGPQALAAAWAIGLVLFALAMIYCGVRLGGPGERIHSFWRPMLSSLLALFALSVCVFFITANKESQGAVVAGAALMLCVAFIPAAAWKDLAKLLISFAFSVQIPLMILEFCAIFLRWHNYDQSVRGEGSDADPYVRVFLGTATRIATTVILGNLVGSIASVFLRRGNKFTPAA